MATNGMTINGLNPLSALTADDKIPVWDTGASGEPTKEITAQNMANSVKSLANLPNTTEMNAAIQQSTAYIDLTTRFAPSNQFDLEISKVYRSGNHITGILKPKTGVSITGMIYTLNADIRPKCTRAMFEVYSFSTGIISTDTSIWIDGSGNLIVFGKPFDGNHACFVDYMI